VVADCPLDGGVVEAEVGAWGHGPRCRWAGRVGRPAALPVTAP
jgi:hypothetical protein